MSGLYFYSPEGKVTEPLFAAMMRHLHFRPASKDAGLRAFKDQGWVLVDATYTPVNRDADRDQVLRRDFDLLCADLRELTGGAEIPAVLLKANVCQILEPLLTANGFQVLNRARRVYFPSHGRQKESAQQFEVILKEAGLLPLAHPAGAQYLSRALGV